MSTKTGTLQLPDLPGNQVLHRLKASTATAAVPVVVVTADATPGQAERLHTAGAAGYLTKPIDIAELLRLLDTTATATPTSERAPEAPEPDPAQTVPRENTRTPSSAAGT